MTSATETPSPIPSPPVPRLRVSSVVSAKSADQSSVSFAPKADEEVTNDLNGNSDSVDLNMKPSGGSGSSSGSRRPGQGTPMDMNMYATRKTIAQDVLINAPQHRYFQVTISLIVFSILLQIIVGIIFIALGRLNINFTTDRRKADMMNNASVILIFLVTVVNVLITAFGPSETIVSSSLAGSPGHHHTASKLTSWTNFYPGSEQLSPGN